jgi:hypothetical protein
MDEEDAHRHPVARVWKKSTLPGLMLLAALLGAVDPPWAIPGAAIGCVLSATASAGRKAASGFSVLAARAASAERQAARPRATSASATKPASVRRAVTKLVRPVVAHLGVGVLGLGCMAEVSLVASIDDEGWRVNRPPHLSFIVDDSSADAGRRSE